jgi:hypothetical protein
MCQKKIGTSSFFIAGPVTMCPAPSACFYAQIRLFPVLYNLLKAENGKVTKKDNFSEQIFGTVDKKS